MGFWMEATMHKPVLFAAMVAALPLGAAAQGNPEAAPGKPAPQSGCAGAEEAPRASSALPARASTKPAPELGTVAPNTRVPSHTVTPSLRAMRAASAKEAARAGGEPRAVDTGCTPSVSRSDTDTRTKKD
jgi:hypothetical protein